MDNYENAINTVRWVFTELFYPIIIIGIFILLIVLIGSVIIKGSGGGRIRRITGAILPLVFLVFSLMWIGKENDPIQQFFSSTSLIYQYLYGALTGLILLEAGKQLQKTDLEVGPSLYTLFLSLVCMFILYSTMQGILGQLNHFLLALIGSSGLYIIFRGLPTPDGIFISKKEENIFAKALQKVQNEQSRLRNEVLDIEQIIEKIMKNEVANSQPTKGEKGTVVLPRE